MTVAEIKTIALHLQENIAGYVSDVSLPAV